MIGVRSDGRLSVRRGKNLNYAIYADLRLPSYNCYSLHDGTLTFAHS